MLPPSVQSCWNATLVALLALLPLALGGCTSAPPDIILISVDTLRPDHLGAWGHKAARTPTLDALAARGFRASNATTPFPRTTPALASLMTGLRPEIHGSREVGQPVVNGITLADLLRSRGYTSVGVNANAAAGRAANLQHGFDSFVDAADLSAANAAAVTDQAIASVAAAGSAAPKAPIFLWAHYVDPHTPYTPPGLDPNDPCATLQRGLDNPEKAYGAIYTNRDGASAAVLGACAALYDREVAYTDTQIGRLLAGLSAQGRDLNKALLIFTSDHGENLGEWGLYYEHGPNVADASLRVPLVIAGPNIPPGAYEGVFRLQDVMPTLLGLIDMPSAERPAMNGVDLSALVTGGQAPSAPILMLAESGSPLHADMFTYPISGQAFGRHCWNDPPYSLCAPPIAELEFYNHVKDPGLHHPLSGVPAATQARLIAARTAAPAERARQYAVRSARFKLVASPQISGEPSYALYDLKADPAEQQDVAGQHPDEVDRLKKELRGWQQSLPPIKPIPRSQQQMDFLKQLGYME